MVRIAKRLQERWKATGVELPVRLLRVDGGFESADVKLLKDFGVHITKPDEW